MVIDEYVVGSKLATGPVQMAQVIRAADIGVHPLVVLEQPKRIVAGRVDGERGVVIDAMQSGVRTLDAVGTE